MAFQGLICPDGQRTSVKDCLARCRMDDPCLSPETIKLVSAVRPWTGKPSVTQLLNGTMLEFLKITTDFWVYPENKAFAVLGTVHHARLEQLADLDNLAEMQFEDELKTGRSDRLQSLHRKVYDITTTLEEEENAYILWDYKTWGSYRVGKFLGMSVAGYVDDPSGATYKRATTVDGRKFAVGDPKQLKLWKPNPLTADLGDLPLQVNAYRIMAEQAGFHVVRLKVQVTVRDGDTVNARGNGIDWRMRSFDVPLMADKDVAAFFTKKEADLATALKAVKWDEPCSPSESWDGRRCCLKFCEVCLQCPQGQRMLAKQEEEA